VPCACSKISKQTGSGEKPLRSLRTDMLVYVNRRSAAKDEADRKRARSTGRRSSSGQKTP